MNPLVCKDFFQTTSVQFYSVGQINGRGGKVCILTSFRIHEFYVSFLKNEYATFFNISNFLILVDSKFGDKWDYGRSLEVVARTICDQWWFISGVSHSFLCFSYKSIRSGEEKVI